jgi:hypothetical protein
MVTNNNGHLNNRHRSSSTFSTKRFSTQMKETKEDTSHDFDWMEDEAETLQETQKSVTSSLWFRCVYHLFCALVIMTPAIVVAFGLSNVEELRRKMDKQDKADVKPDVVTFNVFLWSFLLGINWLVAAGFYMVFSGIFYGLRAVFAFWEKQAWVDFFQKVCSFYAQHVHGTCFAINVLVLQSAHTFC